MNPEDDKTLAFHLLLPLLGFPYKSLGPVGNVLNAYLLTSEDVLVLEVKHRPLMVQTIFSSPLLIHDYTYGESQWLHFCFPKHFQQEVAAFREGKWSLFREEALTLFRTQWSQTHKGVSILAENLLYWVFAKPKAVRDYWEKELALHPKTLDGVELFRLPGEYDLITP